jgi:hypothetical protein
VHHRGIAVADHQNVTLWTEDGNPLARTEHVFFAVHLGARVEIEYLWGALCRFSDE